MKTKFVLQLFGIILITSLISVFFPSIETFMEMSLATRDRCTTRNMSYDLRGDIPIARVEMQFNNPAWGPLDPLQCQNRPLL
jgi:hypothetical protein